MSNRLTEKKNKAQSLWLCILLPVVTTLIMLALGYVRYIVNDDTAMMTVAESFKTNSHSEYLVFINLYYGCILKLLYQLIPAVSWFTVLELTVLCTGFIALYRITLKYGFDMVCVSMLLIFHVFALNNLTFTTISFICAVAAVLFFIENVPKLEKKSIAGIIASAVLMLLALGMRNVNTLIFVLALCIPLFLFSVIKKRNTVSAVAVLLVISIGICSALTFVQNSYVKAMPDDMYYKQFNEYRVAVFDNGLNNVEEHAEELEEMGVSHSTYYLASRWITADKKVYTAETMKKIASVKDFDDKYNTNPVKLVKELLTAGVPTLLTAAMLLFALLLFLALKERRAEVLLTTVFAFGAIGYLYFRRRGLNRVCSPVLISGMLILLFIYVKEKESFYKFRPFEKLKPETLKRGIAAVCIAALLGSIALNVYITNRRERYENTYSEAVEYIKNDTGSIYAYDSSIFNDSELMKYNANILSAKYYGAGNRLSLGGWNLYSYYWYDCLKAENLESYSDSAVLALLDGNVRFATQYTNPDEIVNYFRDNYSIEVEYTTVESFNDGGVRILDFYKTK